MYLIIARLTWRKKTTHTQRIDNSSKISKIQKSAFLCVTNERDFCVSSVDSGKKLRIRVFVKLIVKWNGVDGTNHDHSEWFQNIMYIRWVSKSGSLAPQNGSIKFDKLQMNWCVVICTIRMWCSAVFFSLSLYLFHFRKRFTSAPRFCTVLVSEAQANGASDRENAFEKKK